MTDFDPSVPPADDPLADPADVELRQRLVKARVLFDGLRPIVNAGLFLSPEAIEAAALLREHDLPYFYQLHEELRPHKVLRIWLRAVAAAGKGLAEGEQKVAEKVRLIELADELLDLWYDGSQAWATVKEYGPGCSWRLPGSEVKRYLLRAYGERHQITLGDGRKVPTAPGRQAVGEALDQIEAVAHGGIRRAEPAMRLAGDGARIVLDLCRDDFTVVEVIAGGWRVVEPSPLPLCRADGMLPLPLPVVAAGGALGELRKLLGLGGSEHDGLWGLLVGFVFACLRPGPGFPVLVIGGEQGTGKTSLVRILRTLVDPHKVDVQARPRSEEDLFVNAGTQWLLGYDNLSALSQDWSDAFCRIATGSGYSKRKLYTDRDVSQFQVSRPQIITSIVDVATAPDLLDRSFLIMLPDIDGEQRRGEAELKGEVAALAPRVLGQLLDAAAVALRDQASIELSEVPRMVDVARWVEAGAAVLGLAPEQFLDGYLESAERAGEMALEASLIGGPVRDLLGLAKDGTFRGEAQELLRALNDFMRDLGRSLPRGWPQTPRAMSGQLRRIAPALRRCGYEVAFSRTAGTGSRTVSLSAPATFHRDPKYFAANRHNRHDRHGTPCEPAGCDGRDGRDGRTQSFRSGEIHNSAELARIRQPHPRVRTAHAAPSSSTAPRTRPHGARSPT